MRMSRGSLIVVAVFGAACLLVLVLSGIQSLPPHPSPAQEQWYELKNIPLRSGWRMRKTSAMAKGYRLILREGHPGLKRSLFLHQLDPDGRRSVSLVREESVKKPRPGDVLVGVSPFPNPIQVPHETALLKIYKLKATAYTPGARDNGARNSGLTVLGWPAGYGVVAVDPKVIPLRSLLYVEGYGFAWAADTGSAIKGDRIDLCFPTRKQSMDFGRRNARVYLVSRPRRKTPLMAKAGLYPRQDEMDMSVSLLESKSHAR